jgi:hypothetical protein
VNSREPIRERACDQATIPRAAHVSHGLLVPQGSSHGAPLRHGQQRAQCLAHASAHHLAKEPQAELIHRG